MKNKNNGIWIAVIISSVCVIIGIHAMDLENTGHRRSFLYKVAHPWKVAREEEERKEALKLDLVFSINARDVVGVQRFIDLGADVNWIYPVFNTSMLGRAIEVGSPAIVDALIRSGANVEQAYGDGMLTPLLRAVGLHNVPIITLLLRAGADVNHVNGRGDSPLLIACERGDLDSVEILLEHGAHKDYVKHSSETPLSVAVQAQNVPIVQALIAAGADVNRADSLYRAVSANNIVLVEILLRAGADVNAMLVGWSSRSILSSVYGSLAYLEATSEIDMDLQKNLKITLLREIIRMLTERGARR